MTYDDWKLESPEDEDERLNGPSRRRQARLEYLADQRDGDMEAEHPDHDRDWYAEHDPQSLVDSINAANTR